jgi:hypothetical protein
MATTMTMNSPTHHIRTHKVGSLTIRAHADTPEEADAISGRRPKHSKPGLTIRLHNRDRGTSYLATSAADCSTETELQAYQLAQEHGSTIAIGVTVAEVLRTL